MIRFKHFNKHKTSHRVTMAVWRHHITLWDIRRIDVKYTYSVSQCGLSLSLARFRHSVPFSLFTFIFASLMYANRRTEPIVRSKSHIKSHLHIKWRNGRDLRSLSQVLENSKHSCIAAVLFKASIQICRLSAATKTATKMFHVAKFYEIVKWPINEARAHTHRVFGNSLERLSALDKRNQNLSTSKRFHLRRDDGYRRFLWAHRAEPTDGPKLKISV